VILAALCASLLSAPPAAAPHVTFIFTGDNGGEVAPCG